MTGEEGPWEALMVSLQPARAWQTCTLLGSFGNSFWDSEGAEDAGGFLSLPSTQRSLVYNSEGNKSHVRVHGQCVMGWMLIRNNYFDT